MSCNTDEPCRHGPPPTLVYVCEADPARVDTLRQSTTRYAETRAWHVAAGHVDGDPAVPLDQRPGWQQVEAALDAGEAEVVVVPRPDHVAPSISEFTAMQAEFRARGTVLAAATGAPPPQRT